MEEQGMNMSHGRLGWIAPVGIASAVLGAAGEASAEKILWANWTSATTGQNGSASGSMGCGGDAVDVEYAGQITGAQVDGGNYYWVPPETYQPEGIDNAPASPDIIGLEGGLGVTSIITFSEPVTDPVVAILSLGQPGIPTTYEFDAEFEVLSSGCGYFACGTLEALPDNVLLGYEGNGVIRFFGTFESISWTIPTAEYWHGFTVGVSSERLCSADCDGSGALDLFDFLCFSNHFNAENVYADCDEGCGFDLFDFLCFTNEFNEGCE
jgi:hypothetical protein